MAQLLRLAFHAFVVIQWFKVGILLEEHETFDPVRERLCELVSRKDRDRDAEDLVEFFEGALFSFASVDNEMNMMITSVRM